MKEKQKKEEKYVVKAGLVIISLYQKVNLKKLYLSLLCRCFNLFVMKWCSILRIYKLILDCIYY